MGRAHEMLADFSQQTPSIAPAARDPTTSLPPGEGSDSPMNLLNHATAYVYTLALRSGVACSPAPSPAFLQPKFEPVPVPVARGLRRIGIC